MAFIKIYLWRKFFEWNFIDCMVLTSIKKYLFKLNIFNKLKHRTIFDFRLSHPYLLLFSLFQHNSLYLDIGRFMLDLCAHIPYNTNPLEIKKNQSYQNLSLFCFNNSVILNFNFISIFDALICFLKIKISNYCLAIINLMQPMIPSML